ncbi:polymerase protein [Cacao swollen shoot Togo A virus]|uniref:Replicase n=1 Tax=Cacao swollen shoot Togo A virus TaxID=1960254 RepID=D5LXQ3_9VIRU|nr:polymerase protein [Cacao swollen shoot Togo A virus]ADE61677.1 polymerase protein [Cacao swollen shoot Togo A virus]
MEDDIFDDFRTFMRGLGDYHLRSAITPVRVNEMKEKIGRKRELKAFNRILSAFPNIIAGDPSLLLAKIFRRIKKEEPREIPMLDETLRLLKAEFKHMGILSVKGDPIDRLINMLDNRAIIKSKHTQLKIKFQRLIMCANAINSLREHKIFGLDEDESTGQPCLQLGQMVIIIWGEFITVRSKRVIDSIYSLDVLRMIVDKLTERDNVLMATYIGRKIFPDVYPSVSLIQRVFNVFDRRLLASGNSGYTLLKTYEALVTGVILKKETSQYIRSEEFLSNTLAGLEAHERDVATELIQLLSADDVTPHHLTQVMGLFRLWGHPEVDALKGLEKVQKIGTATKFISEYSSLLAYRKFKEIFYMEYFKKNRKYPECVVSEECWFYENVVTGAVINTKDPRYHLSDWDLVESKETFSIPTTFNLSMIVSDTAISPSREEIKKCSDEGRAAMDPSIRRGVLKWMKDGLINCDGLLRGIDKKMNGLDIEERVIGLYPKEREMNPVARMFALMTLKMRSYVVITENMLSEDILPYIPGITMTYNMLDLAKEMIRATRSQGKQGEFSRTFCINMDFEKWNLNMRKEGTYYVFQELGRLFGLPTLYNKTYDIFRNSTIYLADGSYNPKFDSDLQWVDDKSGKSYEGHIGGFEGLRQKGWTVFTVVLIAYVCDSLGISFRLMGQGDNQVLMVTIHSKNARLSGIDSQASINEISDKIKSLITRLQEVFDGVGLPLKPLETWVSDIYFSYGKMPIYKGVPLCSSLKRISRIFYFSNEDLMTVDNALGAVTANSQAAVMADIHPAVPYFIAKWQHLQCLSVFSRYHPLVGEKMDWDIDSYRFTLRMKDGTIWDDEQPNGLSREIRLMVMASIPKTLGGFNIVTYFDMILRGYSDPPMKDYQWLLILTKGSTGALKTALKNWYRVVLSPSIDYLHLIQDPTSLNLLCPPNSKTLIKRLISETITSLDTQSEFAGWFQELMEISAEKKMETLVKKLTSKDEVNVRLCHDILGATLYGYSESISSKVDKTVTLSRMTVTSKDVVSRLAIGEKKTWNYFLWRTNYDQGEDIVSLCPSEQIRHLRKKGWKKDVVGISTPYPHHFLGGEDETDRPDSYVEVVVNDVVLSHPDRLILTTGSSLPYLGSVTKEKLHSTSARAAYGTEPLITRPIKLLRAIGWFIDEESNWAESIRNLLKAVTDLDPGKVISIPEHVKGSMMHRYLDMALAHGSLWMPSFGPASHLSMSTNTLLEYAKGSKNVTLQFQAMLGLIQFCTINRLLSSEPRKTVRVYRTCPHCIKPVDEPKEDLPTPLTEEDIPSRPDNPYLYVEQEKIALVHKRELDNYESLPIIHRSYLLTYPHIGRRLLTEILATRVATSILYNSQEAESGMTDIAGLSRTIFLKLDIYTTFLTAIKMIWIGISSTPRVMSGEVFPSWSFLKKSIIRRIWESPPSSFSILAGFYLWEETVRELSDLSWAVMPLSYPATPTSIGIAAKNSLIRLAQKTMEIKINSSWIVSPLVKVDPGILLKSNLLFWRGGFKAQCSDCIQAGMSCRIRSYYAWDDLSRIRCNQGHSVFTLKAWRMLKKIVMDIETIGDTIPSVPRKQYSPEVSRLSLTRSEGTSQILVKSSEIQGYSEFPHQVPGNEYLERPDLNVQLRYSYSIPTKALYRIHEGLSALESLRDYGAILVLGDGFGYSSVMCKFMCKNSRVYSWTLIDASSGVQHCLRLSKPPTHYSRHLKIDITSTIDLLSDVSNPNFPKTLSTFCHDKQIDLIISEVELLYSGAIMSPSQIVMMYYQSGTTRILHKFDFKEFSEIVELIQCMRHCFSDWVIFQTPSVGFHSGELWVYMNEPRQTIINHKYLSYNATIAIYDKMRFAHENMGRFHPGEYLDRVNQYLDSTYLASFREQLLDTWFQDATIMYWKEQDFSQLYYSLRTGKRPSFVYDTQGNTVYYLHADMTEKLFERLMTLALSQLEDLQNQLPVILSRNWKLKWERSQEKVGVRSSYKWAPALSTEEHTPIPHRVKTSILSHLPGVMAIREGRSKYTVIGNKIRFTHCSQSPRELKFAISRMATFSSPYA